jgi:hypothetical protein
MDFNKIDNVHIGCAFAVYRFFEQVKNNVTAGESFSSTPDKIKPFRCVSFIPST